MRFARTLSPAGLLLTAALLLAACGGGTDTTTPVTTSPAAVGESVPLGSCDTSATAPDIFLLEDSFQVSGENDTVSFSADWLSADGEGYFGIGGLESVGGEGGIATFEPGDLTYSDGAVSGTTTFTVIGPDVEGVADGDTGTVTFAC